MRNNWYVTSTWIIGKFFEGTNTVTNFASNLLKHKASLYRAARNENIGIQWVDHLIFKTFLLNLRDDLKILTMARNPVDFDAAFQIALGFEADCIPQKKKYCSFCKTETHTTRDCRVAQRQNKANIVNESEQNKKTSKEFKNDNSGYNCNQQNLGLKRNYNNNYGNNNRNASRNPYFGDYSRKPMAFGFPHEYWDYGYTYNPKYWTPMPNQFKKLLPTDNKYNNPRLNGNTNSNQSNMRLQGYSKNFNEPKKNVSNQSGKSNNNFNKNANDNNEF